MRGLRGIREYGIRPLMLAVNPEELEERCAHAPECAIHDTDGLLCDCGLLALYSCGHRTELPRQADPEPECGCARHGDLMGLVGRAA